MEKQNDANIHDLLAIQVGLVSHEREMNHVIVHRTVLIHSRRVGHMGDHHQLVSSIACWRRQATYCGQTAPLDALQLSAWFSMSSFVHEGFSLASHAEPFS